MNYSVDSFQNVHLHASALQGWKTTYSQISAGKLESSLLQLTSARIHTFRERIGQRVSQHGETPRNKICLAIPVGMRGVASIQGREADTNSVFILGSSQEFMCHMPKEMDLFGIAVERDFFDEAVENMSCTQEIKPLLRQPVIKVPENRLSKCRQRLLSMFSEALINKDLDETPERESDHEMAMLGEFIQLLSNPEFERPPSTTHSFIVEKCHQWTISDTTAPPSVIELCERLQVSRRTIQNSFRRVVETTPINYLRCVRLNGVRRDLMITSPSDLSVGEAAANWGFFHLSHFAADYQDLFGELPSRTTRVVSQRKLDS